MRNKAKKRLEKKKSDELKKNLMDYNSDVSKNMHPIARYIYMLHYGIPANNFTIEK